MNIYVLCICSIAKREQGSNIKLNKTAVETSYLTSDTGTVYRCLFNYLQKLDATDITV